MKINDAISHVSSWEKKTIHIHVRLPDGLIARLGTLQAALGLNRSQVMRLAAERYADEFERDNPDVVAKAIKHGD